MDDDDEEEDEELGRPGEELMSCREIERVMACELFRKLREVAEDGMEISSLSVCSRARERDMRAHVQREKW